ncbi:sulfotransferase domain-containing protein [Leifsonia sp. Root112D2]|uniref:sulfotransferase domain-containing protein n=1 Tax=Leifsonia sp. Root112D2 TaxID=1736426 RepID=UPI00138EE8F4|nr:sulfotransferase domain-containing protein [Leifsonia sp. Root112D2]
MFRIMGSMTASVRPLPDFLLIGTKRGGTTSLYYDILKLPNILTLFPSARHLPKANETKGIHYFDTNYWRGERWYRSHLPSKWARQRAEQAHGGRVVVGEASPYYLFHPLAAERAVRLVPDAKLILLLRDPVMRTYSHWKERRRNNAEPLEFRAAIEAEEARLAGEAAKLKADPTYYSYAHEQQSYVAQSRYIDALMPWVERFGLDKILVLASEEYYADPSSIAQQIATFVGIDYVPVELGEHRNAAAGEALDGETQAYLQTLFAEDNARLEALIGRSLPWT